MAGIASKFRNLVVLSACILATLGLAHYFQNNLSLRSPLFGQLPFWLLSITTLLTLQFNRSRLTIISLALMVFYAIYRGVWLESDFLKRFGDLVFLFGAILPTALLFIADRSLLSIHIFSRALLVTVCFTLACVWLWGFSPLLDPVLKTPTATALPLPWLRLDIPAALLILTQVGRILYRPSTSNYTLFGLCLIWLFMHYFPQWTPIPLGLSICALLILFAILTDSYWLAYRDELTGLPSRRALNQLALSLGSNYCVAMLDVDHFKKFNDTHGHDIGDQVLKLVAMHIRNIRGGGKYFRYGGEEFTIVFPRKDSEEALPYLEDLRESIADYKMVLRENNRKQKNKNYRNGRTKARNNAVSVTISIGVANKYSGQTFEQVIKRADEALYRAKEKGRNCVSE